MKKTLLFSLLLLQGAQAFLTVQKRERSVTAFGTHSAAAPNSAAATSPTKPSSNDRYHQTRHVPTFMASHAAGSVNPLVMAQEQGFTPWVEADDSTVDVSYSTIIMACALSMALGFGLGYGT